MASEVRKTMNAAGLVGPTNQRGRSTEQGRDLFNEAGGKICRKDQRKDESW
jgi:hypothetical protein